MLNYTTRAYITRSHVLLTGLVYGAFLAPNSAHAQDPEESPTASTPSEEYSVADQISDLEERLRQTEDLLDEVETRSLLQHIRWTGDFRTMVTHTQYEGASPDGARDPTTGAPIGVNLSNDEQWLYRLRLGMEAQPYKDLRFTGRLTMFKRFGTNTTTSFPQEFSSTRIPRDNTLRVERAWLDWFVSDNIALSVGRVSYTGGSPGELKENLDEVDATWGLHMVDGEYDTANITATLGDNLLVRGFYASWAFPREDDINSFNLPLNNGTKNLRIIGGNIDIHIPALGNTMSQLGVYTVPKFRPFTVPITNPNGNPPNPSNAPPPLDGSLLFPSSKPATMGSYTNLSALLVSKNIGGSGLDVFGSAAIGFLQPEPGAAITYPIGPNDVNGNPIAVPVLGLAGAEKCWTETAMGPTPDASCDMTTTYFLYAGLRYKLPIDTQYAPKLGFEYNWSSQHWISFNQTTDDLTNKLANRGSSYEGYVIVPVNKHLFARLHMVHIQSDYTGGFFGPVFDSFGGTAPPANNTLNVFGAMLNATF